MAEKPGSLCERKPGNVFLLCEHKKEMGTRKKGPFFFLSESKHPDCFLTLHLSFFPFHAFLELWLRAKTWDFEAFLKNYSGQTG